MGSIEEQDVFTVLVTGFAPFKSEFPVNPSWEIAHRLPAYLPPTKTASGPLAADRLPAVRIVVFPEAIHVSYAVVRALVPQLWDGRTISLSTADGPGFTPPSRIDLVLHIGMAGPRLHYALERFGRRDGYAMADVDGEVPAVDVDNPAWAWHGVPPALASALDLDAVLPQWQANVAAAHPDQLTPPDLRLSTDAGRYLCDFTYFSSLAHLYRRVQGTALPTGDTAIVDTDNRSRVVFLHVPAAASADRIEIGRDLVVELIRALVTVEVAGRNKEGVKEAVKAAKAPRADTETGKWYRE